VWRKNELFFFTAEDFLGRTAALRVPKKDKVEKKSHFFPTKLLPYQVCSNK
jgi:hypothetical protein